MQSPFPDPGPAVGVYARVDAREMATQLAERFWLTDLGSAEVEFPRVRDAITDLGRGRTRVEEDSGLNMSLFIVHVDHLTHLLAVQRFRSAPEPKSPPAAVRDDLRDAFYVLLASSQSSVVRRALGRQEAAILSGRPVGLDWLSRRRSLRRFEGSHDEVRAAHADLVAACLGFLATEPG